MPRVATILLLLIAPAGLIANRPMEANVGGKVAPDGSELHIDLAAELHRANVTSRGQGCCVFTSLHHSSLWQNVPALEEFPKWLQAKGLAGGGYPQNVKERITAICKERGVPEPAYIQVEGPDLEILKIACKSGRLPAVTYSRSPTGRYNGQRISHMVSLVHASDSAFCVLDNNYVKEPLESRYEWMTPTEFSKSYAPGWAVILVTNGPPPAPRNRK